MTDFSWNDWEKSRRRRRRRRFLAVMVLAAVGLWWALDRDRKPVQDEASFVKEVVRNGAAEQDASTPPGDTEREETNEPAQENAGDVRKLHEVVAVLPLSGPFAAEGKALQRGMKTAGATAPDDERITVRFVDGWLSEHAVREALVKALERASVGAILVSLPLSKWQAVLGPATKKETLILSLAQGDEAFPTGSPVLSFFGLEEDAARNSVRLLASKPSASSNSVLLLTDGSSYAKRWAESFTAEAARLKWKLRHEVWADGDTASPLDMTEKFSTVFLVGAPHWVAESVRLLELAGAGALYVVPFTLARPTLLESLGPLVDKVHFTVPMGGVAEAETEGEAFEDAFRRKFWKNPDWLARVGYDAVRMMSLIFQQTGEESAQSLCRKALSGTLPSVSFHGLTGSFTVGAQGRVERRMVLARWKDDSFEPLSQGSQRVEHVRGRHIAP
ncbi:MAG: ABC transporter substrate-binding protein [Desulfosoma sp.]